jgi:hypothetical protein
MFDAPLDAWYVWIGLAAASAAAFGVAGAMPAGSPPDAAGAATTVDGVAASPHAAVGSHPLPNADAVRVGRDSLSVRGPGGTAHAALGYGPVTPVTGGALEGVLRGEPPDRAFETPADFRRAIEAARAADPEWRVTDRLFVRRVSWEGMDVVLVG